MRDQPRFFAGVELALFFVLWVLTIWGAWKFSGATVWTAGGIFGLTVTILGSALMRRPGWKNSGFRLDNLWPALARAGLITLCLLAPFAAAVKVKGYIFPPLSGGEMIGALALGILQQAFFLGYLFQRWNTLVRSPVLAVILNALSFALVHLPHLPLVALTVLAGLFFGALFVRLPNVFAIGLAHGVLSLFGGPMLYFVAVLQTTQIGPAELAPLATTLARELQPGDRIGIGPHGVGPNQFGRKFEVPIEPIGAGYEVDRVNREQLRLFFTAKARVFCAITEDDFHRYLEPQLRERLPILAERFVLRRKFSLNAEFWNALIYGNGDVPVLGAFRERVLLVSNRPSH